MVPIERYQIEPEEQSQHVLLAQVFDYLFFRTGNRKENIVLPCLLSGKNKNTPTLANNSPTLANMSVSKVKWTAVEAARIKGQKAKSQESKPDKNNQKHKYHEIPIKYDFPEKGQEEFDMELGKLVSSNGIENNAKKEGKCQLAIKLYENENKELITMLGTIHQRLGQILFDQRADVGGDYEEVRDACKKLKPLAQFAKTANPKINPTLYLDLVKSSFEETVFVGLDGEVIPWHELRGKKILMIPLIRIRAIFIGDTATKPQYYLRSAVVLKYETKGTGQEDTLGEVQKDQAAVFDFKASIEKMRTARAKAPAAAPAETAAQPEAKTETKPEVKAQGDAGTMHTITPAPAAQPSPQAAQVTPAPTIMQVMSQSQPVQPMGAIPPTQPPGLAQLAAQAAATPFPNQFTPFPGFPPVQNK